MCNVHFHRKKIIYLIQKRGFSNLFVDRMFSMVAFRISMLIISLKDDFLKRSVFVRFDKFNLDTWRSILFRLFMKVHLLLRNKGHWRVKRVRDSKPMSQTQSGFNSSGDFFIF